MNINLDNNEDSHIPEASGTPENSVNAKVNFIATNNLLDITESNPIPLTDKAIKNVTDNAFRSITNFIRKSISNKNTKIVILPEPTNKEKEIPLQTVDKSLLENLQRLENAQEVANHINQTATDQTISISPYIREPIVNPSKKKGLTKPEEKFSRLISHERFNSSLRSNFTSTLEDILSESNPPPPYIIIADSEYKSTNWVISQTLDIMKTHPPTAIVPRENLTQYLKNNPSIKHVIMMDDGSYSGEQASRYLTKLKGAITSPTSVHICIPYMTTAAKKLLLTTASDSKNMALTFSPSQIMHSYKEMGDLGYFGYKKIMRPDVKYLLNMHLPTIGGGFSEDTKQKITAIYDHLRLLKKDVFKKTDEALILELNKILDGLPSNDEEDWEPIFEEIKEDLTKIIEGTERFGVDQTLNQVEFDNYVAKQGVGGTESTTPLWMAHKSADGVSTDYTAMKTASKDGLVISPYKEDEKMSRIALVKKLHTLEKASKKGGPTLDETYAPNRISKEEIVSSNRGCFIIADNYYAKPANNEDQLILTIQGKEIPFGGKDGAFQYQLKEGMVFSLKKAGLTTDSELKTFSYKDGEIKYLSDE